MLQDADEGFKVTDRRGRDAEPSIPAQPTGGMSGPADAAAMPGTGEERNLGGLFMMLASEAVIAVGDAPDPASGQRQRDLPHAADMIDVLVLLREKTEGNRTAEETQILDEVLYDLHLRYVRATKSPG
jgi:hypothetical protein